MQFNLTKEQAVRIICRLHSTDDPIRDEALAGLMALQAACGPTADDGSVEKFLNRASDRIEHDESTLPFPADVGRLVLAWLKGMAS